ncbi:hypothetical protein ACP4OV_009088 [Aristida adscensionis]
MSTKGGEDGHSMFPDKNEEKYGPHLSEADGKRQKTSDIWEGFSILKPNRINGNSAECSASKGAITNSAKGGASPLGSSSSHVKQNSSPDFDEARRALAMSIITGGMSLSLVEGPFFQSLVRGLNPQFRMSRSCLDRDIMNLFEREKDILLSIISEAPGGLSFAVDKWKSKETGENYNDDIYISVTACFVDADWKLQRRIVGFKALEFPEDAVFVAENLALLSSDGELWQVHCCTEILNSVVQAGLELIADITDKIRQGIHYITHSAVRKNVFYQYPNDISLSNAEMKLRADLVVTWGSIYKMLGCALYYKDALSHFASTDETFLTEFHLTDEEWNKVAVMEMFLKPLYDITCTFLSTEYKTANLYFLGVYKVYRLLEVTKEHDDFMSAMVENMKVKFDEYWSENNLILACAAVLDPRYKLKLVGYCFRKIYGDADAGQYIDRVVELLRRLFTEYQKCSSSVVTNVVEYHTKDYLFDDYAPPDEASVLDWYLESPAMDLNTDLDILEFWSGMSKCYPGLASLARDILAIPVSTVASKSVFNIGEKVLSHHRTGLSPDLLEMLICLHDWTCPKDRNGIALSAIEQHYCDEDEDNLEESDDDQEDIA